MSLYSGLTVIELLGIAAKKESEAAGFYRGLSVLSVNPIIKERFLTLSREEQKHRALIVEEYRRLTGEEKIHIPRMAVKDRKMFDVESFSIEDALLYAIGNERDSQKLYAAAAKASTDPRGQRLLAYLVQFEKGHERQLAADLAFYREEPGWFEGRDDMLHVGP